MKRLLPLFYIFLVALAGCSKKPEKKMAEAPPIPVSVQEIVTSDVPLYLEALGTIAPYQISEVKPQISGMIQEIHFKEGEWVEKGELLYTIESTSYEIKLQEAEALLAQNLANLNNAQKKLERYKSLAKQDIIPKVEYDELESKVALFEAMVQAGRAGVAAAQLHLQHCRITAPISGRSGKSSLHVGNMVSPAVTLVSVSQEKSLLVDFPISEKELYKLSSSLSVAVFQIGQEKCAAKGKVTFLDHKIDSKSGMLAARAHLTEMDQTLWAGQSVRVRLFFGKKEQAKLIPLKAIKTNQAGPYIYAVKEDNTVELRNVKLGPEENGMIVVEEGLEGASKIVTEGQSRLFNGSKIEESSR